MHAGPEVEIEDDIVRLRRRKREYEADAARRTGPDRLRTTVAGPAKQAVSKRMAVGRTFSSLIRGLRRRAALLRTRRPRGDRPASIPRIRWYS
jgi:hypothetical protein